MVGVLLFIDGVEANGVGNGVGDVESFADVKECMSLECGGRLFFVSEA